MTPRPQGDVPCWILTEMTLTETLGFSSLTCFQLGDSREIIDQMLPGILITVTLEIYQLLLNILQLSV